MARPRLSADAIVSRLAAVHLGKGYTYPYGIPATTREKVRFVCPTHGESSVSLNAHINRSAGCAGCARVAGASRVSTETWLGRFAVAHPGSGYTYPESIQHSSRPVSIRCPRHGLFTQLPYVHARGSGCPQCGAATAGAARSLSASAWVTRFAERHAGRAYSYLDDVTHSKRTVTIVCAEHGTFTQRASSHAEGHGCPGCRDAHNRLDRLHTDSEWRAKFLLAHGDRGYTYPDAIVDGRVPLAITCPAHGVFSQPPAQHARGHGCPQCAHELPCAQSAWEREVGEYLRGIGVSAAPGWAALDADTLRAMGRDTDPTRGHGLGLDWLGVTKTGAPLAVECHGVWAHCALRKPALQDKHRLKYDVATAQGMGLVQIFEADWLDPVIRPRLERHLRQRFGVNPVVRELQAPRLRVWPVEAEQARAFCEANHIQGGRPAIPHALGLHDAEGGLVALMVYGVTRRYGDPVAEVHRYCTLDGVKVHGGMGRLTREVRACEGLPVRSMCDTMLFSGQSYAAAGYVLEHIGAPQHDYRYWFDDAWVGKEWFQVPKLARKFPPDHAELRARLGREPTEMEFAEHLGAFRLHGTGKQVWVFRG